MNPYEPPFPAQPTSQPEMKKWHLPRLVVLVASILLVAIAFVVGTLSAIVVGWLTIPLDVRFATDDHLVWSVLLGCGALSATLTGVACWRCFGSYSSESTKTFS